MERQLRVAGNPTTELRIAEQHGIKASRLPHVRGATRVRYHEPSQGVSIISQGFKFGDILLVPETNFRYTSWLLIHKPSGARMAAFPSEDIRLGVAIAMYISGWDWRGEDVEKIPTSTRAKWADLFKFFELSHYGEADPSKRTLGIHGNP